MLAHVAVAVARELDDAPLRHAAGRQLLVVDRLRARDEERVPAGVGQALAEVDLVGVDEELRVEPADLARRLRAHEQRGALRPVDRARAVAAALHRRPAVDEERRRERARRPGEAPGARPAACRPAAAAARPRRRRAGSARAPRAARRSRRAAARSPRSAAARSARSRAQQRGVVLRLAGAPLARDHAVDGRRARVPRRPSRRSTRCRARAPRSRTATAARSRAIASSPRTRSSRCWVFTTQ